MATLLPRLLSVLALACLGLVPAAAADAADARCDPLVIDTADVLTDSAVRAAAVRVQDEAADVRVVTYRRVPGGNLDKHMAAEAKRCTSWQGPGAEWKNNLIVLAVSVEDRTSGLYYAETFEHELDRSWPRIQAEAMNPRFARADFTGGMEAALLRVAATLDPTSSPSLPTRSGLGTEVPGEPAAPGTDVPAWLWVVPLIVGGGAGLTWTGVRTRRRLRTRSQARAAAASANDTADATFLSLDAALKFTQARVEALPPVDDRTVTTIRARFSEVGDRSRAAIADYLKAADQYPTEKLTSLGTNEATTAAAELTGIADVLTKAAAGLTELEAALDELTALETELPARVDATHATVTEAAGMLRQRAVEGFFTDKLSARLDQVGPRLEKAAELAAQSRFGDAAAAVTESLAAAEDVRDEAQLLPSHLPQLRADLTALRDAEDRCRALVAAATSVCDDLDTSWHVSCNTGVREELRRATTALVALPAVLDDLDRVSSMAVQDFAAGYAAANRCRELVAVIEEASNVPAARRQELIGLAADLPAQADEVTAALDALAEAVTTNASAVPFLDQPVDVSGPAADLSAVASELGQDRPRLLWARDTLSAVAASIRIDRDRVSDVVAAYEQVERSLARAAAKVAQSAEETRGAHAGQRSRTLADEARSLLDAAGRARDLDTRGSKAASAASRAEDAIAEAQRSARAHRARSASPTTRGGFSSTGGGGSRSGAGGGRSSSGGRRSGGGFKGGSSSFRGKRSGGGFKGGSSKF